MNFEKKRWIASLEPGDEVFIGKGVGMGFHNLQAGVVTGTGDKGWVSVKTSKMTLRFGPRGFDKRTYLDTYWIYPGTEDRKKIHHRETVLNRIRSFNFKSLDTIQLEVVWSVLSTHMDQEAREKRADIQVVTNEDKS